MRSSRKTSAPRAPAHRTPARCAYATGQVRGDDLRDRQPAQSRRDADHVSGRARATVRLNLIAGKRAKASAAHAAALDYFTSRCATAAGGLLEGTVRTHLRAGAQSR